MGVDRAESGPAVSAGEAVRLATFAMGCRFELVLAGADSATLHAAGEEAIAEIESLHARLTAFERSSVVSAINRAAGRHAVRVDHELLGLFTLCAEVSRQSGGAFDVAVGRVLEAHGYRRSPTGLSGEPVPSMPRDRGCEGIGDLIVDVAISAVALSSADLSLDLGAVAKGFAIDSAMRCIRDADIPSALIHAGTSTILGHGRRPDGEPWRVAIPSAQGDDDSETLRIDVSGRTLAISGTSVQGRHIIDPRTGERSRRAGVCAVIAESAAEADAWSTALFVLGGEHPTPIPSGLTRIVERAGGSWCVEGVDSGLVRQGNRTAGSGNTEVRRATG